VPEGSPNFDSETTESFEVGGKFTYMGGNARTNIAAFHTEIDDLQVAFFEGIEFKVVNAAGAVSTGIEVEHQQQLGENFSLDAGFTYLADAKFSEDPALVASGQGQISGRNLTRAPEFAFNLALNGETALSSGLTGYGRAAYQYTGKHFTTPAVADENAVEDAYGLVDLTAGLRLENNDVSIEAFCLNCFDKDYVSVHFNHPIVHSAASPDINGYLGAPRTYGVRLKGTF